MLNMNYKKALLAATVLTAFCANAAFAGNAPDKPTMRERVDRILKCEDRVDCPEFKEHKRFGKHHRHQLTEEQIKEREARREAWKKMSPEERKEAVKKWRAERREKHNQRVEAKMNKLTPEQRKEVEDFIKKDREFHREQREEMRKHREKQREEMRDMTKEQREAIRVQQPPKFGKHHKAPHHKGFHHMPPIEKVDK
ncbi:MAG: hypothetical protein IJV92_01175 [Phascolarctobacterium sp.]|nr:hypothetical protein [Phascolarctobacterium sp.]